MRQRSWQFQCAKSQNKNRHNQKTWWTNACLIHKTMLDAFLNVYYTQLVNKTRMQWQLKSAHACCRKQLESKNAHMLTDKKREFSAREIQNWLLMRFEIEKYWRWRGKCNNWTRFLARNWLHSSSTICVCDRSTDRRRGRGRQRTENIWIRSYFRFKLPYFLVETVLISNETQESFHRENRTNLILLACRTMTLSTELPQSRCSPPLLPTNTTLLT